LDNPQLRQLKKLDLHYHFISKGLVKSLKQAFPGVNLDDPQDSDADPEDRFVAVSE